jgi:hypothetical protein
MKKNKKIKILIGVIILIFLGLFFLFFNRSWKQKEGSLSLETTPQINDLSFKDTLPGQTSVSDFMNKLQKEGKISFTEKNYLGMGEFIDSINGIKNNNNLSWIYYVNGKEAQVGVSNYKINPGDIVSWKYEKSY